MINVIKGWFEKHFSDPQAIILVSILVLGAILIVYWGKVLTPVLAGIIIAYVLEGLVNKIMLLGVPRFISFLLSYTLFITALALILFGLVPLVISQGSQLIVDFPHILSKVQALILTISEQYPIFADQEIEKMLGSFSSELVSVGQTLVSVSLSSAVDAFTVLVYLVVVPLLATDLSGCSAPVPTNINPPDTKWIFVAILEELTMPTVTAIEADGISSQ